MALAIVDHTFEHTPRPGRPAHQGSGRGRFVRRRPGRCRAVRRRQCVAGLVVVALGTGGFVIATEAVAALGRRVIEPTATSPSEPTGDWVARPVAAGESLWSIAESSAGTRDIRPLVDELVRLNGGTQITAGDSVRIPAAWAEGPR